MALTQVSTGGIKDGQVHTVDLADAQITAGKLHADALDHTYTLGASGSDHYTFTGEGLTGAVNDPTLYLTRGKTYRFVNGNSGGAHPFRIQSVAGAGGTEYNTGVTNNAGAGGSTIIFEVPHDAPDVLYYICTSHATMNGIFYVTGALADGTVTTAKLADGTVTTAKLADDAVTDAKIANSINTAIAANTAKTSNATHTGDVTGSTSLTIADNAVVTAKIADDAVTADKLADSINTSISAKMPLTGGTFTGGVTGTTLADSKGDLRSVPANTQSSAYTLVAADAGKTIVISSGGVTIPASGMSAGDVVTIINNSTSNQTITLASGVTLFNTGDGTNANRTLAGRGMATIYFVSAATAYISGAGLS